MTQIIVVILGLAAIAGVVLFIRWYNRSTEWTDEIRFAFNAKGIDKKYWTPKYDYTTPKGVFIRSAGTVPPNALDAIDAGLDILFDRYTRGYPEWTNYKKHSDYVIYLINPMGTNEVNDPGSPCMFVNGIQAAATVLGTNDHYEALDIRPAIIACNQADRGWAFLDYLKRSIHYEGEHALAWRNRQNNPTGMFYNYLGVNDVHPQPLPGEAVGFASMPTIQCNFTPDADFKKKV